MDSNHADGANAQVRAAVYARLSEARDAAESVPTQLEHVAGFLSVGPARAAWPRAWQLSTGRRSVPAFPAWRGSTAPLRRRLGGTRHARQRSAIPGAACKGVHHRGLATWGIT